MLTQGISFISVDSFVACHVLMIPTPVSSDFQIKLPAAALPVFSRHHTPNMTWSELALALLLLSFVFLFSCPSD